MNRIVRIVAVALMSFAITACATTQGERQESADQIFGKAKVIMNIAQVSVGAYNVLCIGMIIPEGACTGNIRELVNSSSAKAADILARTEKVFAAGNTEGVKLDYAKLAQAAVAELMDALVKYNIDKLGAPDARIAAVL